MFYFYIGYQLSQNLSEKAFLKIENNLINPLIKDFNENKSEKLPGTLINGIKKIFEIEKKP